jgi:hypothetical protein
MGNKTSEPISISPELEEIIRTRRKEIVDANNNLFQPPSCKAPVNVDISKGLFSLLCITKEISDSALSKKKVSCLFSIDALELLLFFLFEHWLDDTKIPVKYTEDTTSQYYNTLILVGGNASSRPVTLLLTKSGIVKTYDHLLDNDSWEAIKETWDERSLMKEYGYFKTVASYEADDIEYPGEKALQKLIQQDVKKFAKSPMNFSFSEKTVDQIVFMALFQDRKVEMVQVAIFTEMIEKLGLSLNKVYYDWSSIVILAASVKILMDANIASKTVTKSGTSPNQTIADVIDMCAASSLVLNETSNTITLPDGLVKKCDSNRYVGIKDMNSIGLLSISIDTYTLTGSIRGNITGASAAQI